ncbi:Protein bir1 [Pseudocercospora fuligena]|uniref:Protein bir1 n=1 Tax=Pseudocercospora fuligena TaxID=685502 RepID=A0A8H6VEJ5_9PEZI|nr:Protein bir1 [Pseudocercospora fuligena]
MSSPGKEMNSFVARLATFEQPHQLTKRRRASSNSSKRKGGNTVEWPHEQPSKEALARAGFFYRPAHDSNDNVQCFLCAVKLDGWEESDDPISEHLAHAKSCAWATAVSVTRDDETQKPPEDRDPLSEELYEARKATFQVGDGWPHESKKGWKCKITKLVEAGWCWDPSVEGDEPDGVTCFYCALSLDGWEPKDDPFVEHKRREPDCRYFQLLEQYHGAAEPPKKGKGRGKARSSTASKASRMSTQSAVTTTSDAPSQVESLGDIPMDSSVARIDDSIVTAGTTSSTATANKGKKKGGRTKAAAKGTKGKKKTSEEEDVEMLEQYPAAVLSSQLLAEDEPPPPVPAKSTRRGGRGSKQPQADSSIIEISAIEAAPPKKATRGRKAKAQPEPEPEPEIEPEIAPPPQTPDADAIEQKRLSEVSAQLQDELEHSVDNFDGELDQSTPLADPPKRGVKRTSDGLRKQQESSVIEITSPPPQPKPAAKAKRGRKPKQNSSASTDIEQELVAEVDFAFAPERRIELELPESQGAEADDEQSQPAKAKAGPKKGKGKAKGKKTSSARSSKATATTSEPEPAPAVEESEDLARDEMEIEQELARIASEQQSSEEAQPIQVEQDLVDEYETSPSQGRVSKDSAELQQLQHEVDTEEPATQEKASTPPRTSQMPGSFTPSPGGSDKENQPSSVMQPQTAQKLPAVILSPTKTTRIPVAASAPNRSPAKSMLSPSKQMGGLKSAAPWTAVDLDSVLLPSPQPSPGRVGEQLVAAAGALTNPEKKMSVEEWVRHRAAQGEEELRRKCERMVEAFEKQGMRGIQSLEGIEVV